MENISQCHFKSPYITDHSIRWAKSMIAIDLKQYPEGGGIVMSGSKDEQDDNSDGSGGYDDDKDGSKSEAESTQGLYKGHDGHDVVEIGSGNGDIADVQE